MIDLKTKLKTDFRYIVTWYVNDIIGELQYRTDTIEDAKFFSSKREEEGYKPSIFIQKKVTFIKKYRNTLIEEIRKILKSYKKRLKKKKQGFFSGED